MVKFEDAVRFSFLGGAGAYVNRSPFVFFLPYSLSTADLNNQQSFLIYRSSTGINQRVMCIISDVINGLTSFTCF